MFISSPTENFKRYRQTLQEKGEVGQLDEYRLPKSRLGECVNCCKKWIKEKHDNNSQDHPDTEENAKWNARFVAMCYHCV